MFHSLIRNWRGGVLVASHDRELLEKMDRIVELNPVGVRIVGGGWSVFAALRKAERDKAATELERSPFEVLKGKNRDPGATNIRNVASPHWKRWLGVESRCVVPFSSFSENETLADGSRSPVWFAFDESRPLAFFAGLWTRWTSVRKVKEGETANDLYGFLTTAPNVEVKAIHPKAMPVILTTPEEVDIWMRAPTKDALALQRLLPGGSLQIVARGDRTGDAAGAEL